MSAQPVEKFMCWKFNGLKVDQSPPQKCVEVGATSSSSFVVVCRCRPLLGAQLRCQKLDAVQLVSQSALCAAYLNGNGSGNGCGGCGRVNRRPVAGIPVSRAEGSESPKAR